MFHKFDIDGWHMAIVYMPASITEIDRKRKGRDATNCQNLFFPHYFLVQIVCCFIILQYLSYRCTVFPRGADSPGENRFWRAMVKWGESCGGETAMFNGVANERMSGERSFL